MLVKSTLCLAAATAVSGFGFPVPNFASLAVDSGLALSGLNSIALLNALGNMKGTCNVGNVKIRQEWRTLTTAQRKNYISAAKCVMNKPSILPPGQVPAAHTLYDDFTWLHVRLTNFVHLTGNFMTWHRYFIHIYEENLKQCGYNGNLPYWEWGLDVKNPAASPVFDGSDTSLGSDGINTNHGPLILSFPTGERVTIPPGNGGGCIKSGPFKGLNISIGPVVLPEYGTGAVVFNPNPEVDNPRCVKRDLSPWVAQKWTTFRNTTDLILGSSNIFEFHSLMNGDPRGSTDPLGVHGGGHFTIGGDPGADPFIAPGDPAFYLHHAQIDRVYWIWQQLDLEHRQNVWGTNTFLDQPPSANTTVEDLLDFAPLASSVKIKDIMNTVGGSPLCYVYI